MYLIFHQGEFFPFREKLWIIGLIKNFKGDEWQCPIAYSIACIFVKGEDKEEPKEEKEEEKEEK